MIDRSDRGGMGPTNAGGKPMSRVYPAKPKSNRSGYSPVNQLAQKKAAGSFGATPPAPPAFKPKGRLGGY